MKSLRDIVLERLKINSDSNLVEYTDFCDYTTCVNILNKIDDSAFLFVYKKVFDQDDTIYNYAFAFNNTDGCYPGCTVVGGMFDKLKYIGGCSTVNAFMENLFGCVVSDIRAFEFDHSILLEILIKVGPSEYVNTYNVFSNNDDFKMENFKDAIFSEFPELVETPDNYSILQLYKSLK